MDDSLASVQYLNPQAPTPNVSLSYDPILPRLTSMTDGTGTSSYSYYPLNGGQLGAGRIHTITQPVGGTTATIEYTYDADGRVASRSIDGVAENYGYTNAELTSVSNPLGGFGYSYDSSARLNQMTYPNGQKTNYDYFTPADPLGASGSLKDITNLNPSSAILSKFSYSYNPTGDIKTWTQQLSSNTNAYGMGYDPDSELAAVTQTAGTTGFDGLTANHAVTYGYDAAGNKTNETAPTYSQTFGTNNLNELTSVTSNPISVVGATSLPATVTVNGTAVTEDSGNNFSTTITPVGGNSTPLTVQSVASTGQATTDKFHVLNAAPFSTDSNGNMTSDSEKNYTWDAANRLVQINYIGARPATMVDTIQMAYDGEGRRVSVTELHGSTMLTAKTFVWCGAELCQERDGAGHTVTKQFFDQGERIGTTNYFYTFDHLGSVREMTDSSGTIQGQFTYDPWGRSAQIAGTLQPDFGYTGFYVNQTTGLDLTWFRAYDSNKGRWLSKDPLGSEYAISNLFLYSHENPLRFVDPLGLMSVGGGFEYQWFGKNYVHNLYGPNPSPSGTTAAAGADVFIRLNCNTHIQDWIGGGSPYPSPWNGLNFYFLSIDENGIQAQLGLPVPGEDIGGSFDLNYQPPGHSSPNDNLWIPQPDANPSCGCKKSCNGK